MLIDWFTVGAQAFNFLILVWLMKRFLYGPILHAIDEREKRVAAELADARAKQAEATKERDEFQNKNEEFNRQRAALLSQVAGEASATRTRLIEEASAAADALSARRQEAMRTEFRNLNQAISHRTQQEVFATARKALADLASASLEERMVDVFTRRLRQMGEQEQAEFTKATTTATAPAVVRSAFDLPAQQRAAIQNALNEIASAEIPLLFETAPDLIGGIELTCNGRKVAWSIAEYLTSLQSTVGKLLKESYNPTVNALPKSEEL